MSNNGERNVITRPRPKRISLFYQNNRATILWIMLSGLLVGACVFLVFTVGYEQVENILFLLGL